MIRRRPLASACLLAGLTTTTAAQDASDITEHERLARASIARLAEQGVDIDVDSLSFELRAASDAAADVQAQQAIFSVPRRDELFVFLVEGLLLDDELNTVEADELEGFRRIQTDALLSGVLAYYQPERDSLVFLADDMQSFLAQLGGQHELVLHEVVHAWQDQQQRLVEVLSDQPSTDALRAAHMLLEGEAQVLAAACILAEDGQTLDAMPTEIDQQLARLTGGPLLARLYSAGRRAVHDAWRAGGRDAIAALLAAPPTSTEQLLHPAKLGVDLPSEVRVPHALLDLGLRVEVSDTAGELDLYQTLLMMEVPEGEARQAALGWDGDRQAWLISEDDRHVAFWRTLWDRPEDAEHFARLARDSEAFEGSAGELLVSGRRVDWFHARGELEERIRDTLRRLPAPPPADPRDVATTEAAEDALAAELAQGPRAREGVWELGELGIRLAIPAGWEAREFRGAQLLMRSDQDGSTFAANVNATSQPRPPGMSDAELVEFNRDSFEQVLALTLDRFEEIDVAGQPGLRMAYHGDVGTGTTLHFEAVLLYDATRQVIVTCTCNEAQHDELAPVFDELLASVVAL